MFADVKVTTAKGSVAVAIWIICSSTQLKTIWLVIQTDLFTFRLNEDDVIKCEYKM